VVIRYTRNKLYPLNPLTQCRGAQKQQATTVRATR